MTGSHLLTVVLTGEVTEDGIPVCVTVPAAPLPEAGSEVPR